LPGARAFWRKTGFSMNNLSVRSRTAQAARAARHSGLDTACHTFSWLRLPTPYPKGAVHGWDKARFNFVARDNFLTNNDGFFVGLIALRLGPAKNIWMGAAAHSHALALIGAFFNRFLSADVGACLCHGVADRTAAQATHSRTENDRRRCKDDQRRAGNRRTAQSIWRTPRMSDRRFVQRHSPLAYD
jgi:hypothetical protein